MAEKDADNKPDAEDEIPDELLKEWEREQDRMRQSLVDIDQLPDWDGPTLDGLRTVAGIDISFFKDSLVRAVAAITVLDFPSMKHRLTLAMDIRLTQPYKCGYLGFREVPWMCRLLDSVRREHPALVPQVVLVDGNGVLHPRRCGSASHFGVYADCPTIGVAKNLVFHTAERMNEKMFRAEHRDSLAHRGDSVPIMDDGGKVLGTAYVNADSCKPVYVSVGHRVGLETAVKVVQACSIHRVPEPIRLADLDGRSIVRELCGEDRMLAPPKGRDVRLEPCAEPEVAAATSDCPPTPVTGAAGGADDTATE